MAFFQMNYHSDAIGMGVSVNVILPESAKTLIGMNAQCDANYKTLYLLHGLSDDHTIWMRRTSIERYAAEYGIAVVMPCVARSWYTDTAYGAKYFTFVSRELPDTCQSFFRGMSSKREDNFVAGLSMGGYGAMKVAMTFPERFGGCASLSGTLDIADVTRNRPMDEWAGIFGFGMQSVSELSGTQHDLFALAEKLAAAETTVPQMYFWCGESDHNIRYNRRFAAHLSSLKLDHCFESSEGDHSWKWWDLHIQDALRYFLAK